jgi:hypothetical protein
MASFPVFHMGLAFSAATANFDFGYSGFANGIVYPVSTGMAICVFEPQDPPMIPTPPSLLANWKATNATITVSPPSVLVVSLYLAPQHC